MSRPLLLRSTARWPFWFLLAAWFCANSPQAATYGLIVWLGEARHFSHQQRLSADVASVLAGHEVRPTLAAAHDLSQQPFALPLPAEATLKKFDLFVSTMGALLPPAARSLAPCETIALRPATPWRELLSEPPRAA